MQQSCKNCQNIERERYSSFYVSRLFLRVGTPRAQYSECVPSHSFTQMNNNLNYKLRVISDKYIFTIFNFNYFNNLRLSLISFIFQEVGKNLNNVAFQPPSPLHECKPLCSQ